MNSNSITALKMANDFIKSMGYQSKKNFHSLSIPKNKGTHNNWGNRKKKIMKKRSKFCLSCLSSKCQKWNQKNGMTFKSQVTAWKIPYKIVSMYAMQTQKLLNVH